MSPDRRADQRTLSTDMLSTPMTGLRQAVDREEEEDDEADKMDCNSLQGIRNYDQQNSFNNIYCDQQSDLNDLHLYIAGSIEQSEEELQNLIQQINTVSETIMNI